MAHLVTSDRRTASNFDEEKANVSGHVGAEALLLAQNFEVPAIVKQRIEADMAQATSAAVITALFSGTLVTLAQLVVTTDGSELVPKTLRWFSYSSIFLAITATFLCLTCVRMCSDLPGFAAQLIVRDPNSLPARVARGEPIPAELFSDMHELMRQFGGAPAYQAVDNTFNLIFMFGCACTFTSLIIWIWHGEETPLAGSVMATVIPTVFCVIWSFRPAYGFRARIVRAFK